MSSNAIFFGWNRSIPGREAMSAEHFTQFIGYLTSLKSSGSITSFEPVFMNPHGGTMNGFFLIHGDSQKLHMVTETTEWTEHMIRASLHLESCGAVFAATGNEVMARMQMWTKSIPAR
jgi:hypothetical protein